MSALRRFSWRHPHWWAAALCAVAWLWLAVAPLFQAARGSHAHGFDIADWALMMVTMMTPLVFAHMRFTATRSLWPRRHRAIAAFLCGYAGTWLLVGLGLWLAFSTMGLSHATGSPWMAAAAFTVAAGWQLAPWKRRALVECHRTMPMAPIGWRADRDCARYGWTIGAQCVISCGALMLGCVIAGHSLVAMLIATAIATAERLDPRAGAFATSTALAIVATMYAVTAM